MLTNWKREIYFMYDSFRFWINFGHCTFINLFLLPNLLFSLNLVTVKLQSYLWLGFRYIMFPHRSLCQCLLPFINALRSPFCLLPTSLFLWSFSPPYTCFCTLCWQGFIYYTLPAVESSRTPTFSEIQRFRNEGLDHREWPHRTLNFVVTNLSSSCGLLRDLFYEPCQMGIMPALWPCERVKSIPRSCWRHLGSEFYWSLVLGRHFSLHDSVWNIKVSLDTF